MVPRRPVQKQAAAEPFNLSGEMLLVALGLSQLCRAQRLRSARAGPVTTCPQRGGALCQQNVGCRHTCSASNTCSHCTAHRLCRALKKHPSVSVAAGAACKTAASDRASSWKRVCRLKEKEGCLCRGKQMTPSKCMSDKFSLFFSRAGLNTDCCDRRFPLFQASKNHREVIQGRARAHAASVCFPASGFATLHTGVGA